jgi:hypothetical protein
MEIHPVPIELDKPRTLWMNFNAMAKFEEVTGKNLFKSMAEPSASDLLALVWASLTHEDKDLTIEQVGEFVDLSNMEYVTSKLLEAWGATKPKNAGNLPTG